MISYVSEPFATSSSRSLKPVPTNFAPSRPHNLVSRHGVSSDSTGASGGYTRATDSTHYTRETQTPTCTCSSSAEGSPPKVLTNISMELPIRCRQGDVIRLSPRVALRLLRRKKAFPSLETPSFNTSWAEWGEQGKTDPTQETGPGVHDPLPTPPPERATIPGASHGGTSTR